MDMYDGKIGCTCGTIHPPPLLPNLRSQPSRCSIPIRSRLRGFPRAHFVARTLYRWAIRSPEPVLPRAIRDALRGRMTVSFVQVGSHDGITGDPIHNLVIENTHWRGVFVEPVRRNFDRLRETYRTAKDSQRRLSFENAAIDHSTGVRKFFYLSDAIQSDKQLLASLPFTYDQLSSFNKEHVESLGSGVRPYILEMDMPCLSLQDLLDKHRIEALDLIHIDTEGFDYSVLRQIDFNRYRPKVILYEHVHLTPQDQDSAIVLLKRHGYDIQRFGGDTMALSE